MQGTLAEGWKLRPSAQAQPTFVLLTDTEIFGWAKPRRRPYTRKKAASPESFFAELHEGKTLEEIAEKQGVEIEDVHDAINAARGEAMRDAIEQAVENGRITQEQADWLLEGLEQGFFPMGRSFRFGHGMTGGFGRGMRGHFGSFAPRSAPSVALSSSSL